MSENFSFKKNERLHHIKLINHLFENGESFMIFPFRVQYLFIDKKEENSNVQILISIPKKRIKKAVDRNLIKRRTREAYRQTKHILLNKVPQNKSLIFAIIYSANEVLNYAKIDKFMEKFIGKMEKNIEKSIEK